MHSDLMFTDGGLEEGSEAQPRSAVGCSVLFGKCCSRVISFSCYD
ncbi:hypothetical protein [Rubritalea tangerina]